MEPNYIKQALDNLGKSHFSRTWPETSLEAVYEELKAVDGQAMVAAIKTIRLEISPSTFPALKRVVEIIKQEQSKIFLAQSPPEPLSRRENDKQFKSVFGDMESEHARLSIRLCTKIADGELTLDQTIEACKHMETKFPNVGWRDTMMFYIRKSQIDNKMLSAGTFQQ